MSKSDEAWFTKHFPSPGARDKADRATDALSPTQPMVDYIDVWIAAYKAAGGKVNLKV